MPCGYVRRAAVSLNDVKLYIVQNLLSTIAYSNNRCQLSMIISVVNPSVQKTRHYIFCVGVFNKMNCY